jgi:hypothetical protein
MKPQGVLKFSGIGKSVESMSEPQVTADAGAALNGPLADSGALNGDCTSGPFIIGAGGLRKESLNKIGMYNIGIENELWKNSARRYTYSKSQKRKNKSFLSSLHFCQSIKRKVLRSYRDRNPQLKFRLN